jgi:predicted metal-dependent hydrolase
MSTSIQLLNFLEDNHSQIINLVKGKINQGRPGYQDMSADTVEALVDQLLDGYVDVLVTGQTDAVDKVFHVISRLVAAKGVKISEVFELPLVMTSVIRRLLAEEYKDSQGEDTLRKFNQALEQVDATGSRVACRFLDIFQEMLEKRIDGHNDYLAKVQRQYGIDLSSFRIEPEST